MNETGEEKKERRRLAGLAAGKRWRERNPDKIRLKAQRYRAANPEKYLAGQKAWFAENREKRNAYAGARDKLKRKTDPYYKLKKTLRGRLNKALKDQGTGKGKKTFELLGCAPSFLMQQLELRFRDGMTWENHGTVWEVDHIRPCASFDLRDVEQQKCCFHYTNLQPLLCDENRRKGALQAAA